MPIAEEIGGPVVLKSQVLSGGRMKAGAVKFADTADECPALFERSCPSWSTVRRRAPILVEEKSPVAQEYFVSVTWDGRRKLPVLLFSDMGGIDIEEVAEKHPEHVSKTHFSTILPLTRGSPRRPSPPRGRLGQRSEPAHAHRLRADAGLPAVRPHPGGDQPAGPLEDGRFIVLDGHVDMEAEARGRHGSC